MEIWAWFSWLTSRFYESFTCIKEVCHDSVNTFIKANAFIKGTRSNLSSTQIKVAGVVNLKWAFTNWCFYNLIILIKFCKIQHLNLDKAPLFLRNQVICLKIGKLGRATTTTEFNIFGWNFAHVSYLTMSPKGCLGFFNFV